MPDTTPPNPQDLLGIDDNKVFAAMSYLGVLVFVPLIMKKNDPFVYFHVKQGLVLLASFVLAGIAGIWISTVGTLLFLLLLLANVIALIQALQGRRWQIPLIGTLASKFRV
jgi:fumarate reductase subunit D